MNNNKIEEHFLLGIRLHSQWVEVWLNVRGYPKYEVSSQGRVRNLKTKEKMKPENRPRLSQSQFIQEWWAEAKGSASHCLCSI